MLKCKNRIGEEKYNNQGCLMEIIGYNNSDDITIEFKDEYKFKTNTQYSHFIKGQVKNPYHKSVFDIGIIGYKYPVSLNNKTTKEYNAWSGVLRRCFDNKIQDKRCTYKNVTCCDEWLLYENFYEWLHSQENFDKWYDGNRWAVDKDILIKGNKIYSPSTCCLVPININSLFIKSNANRGDLPIGVLKKHNLFVARCNSPFTNKREHLGIYNTPEEAFKAYKKRKEEIIEEVAEIEYAKGNITKKCYDAMIKYEVEITD